MDTLKRIQNSNWANTTNKAKRRDLLISAALSGFFLFGLIMFLVSSGGLAAFWCVMFILAILGAGFFVYSALKLTDARYS